MLKFFVKTIFYGVMKRETAFNFLNMEFCRCENLCQFFEAIQLPYHLLRSIKEGIFPFFQQVARAIGGAIKKVLFFLSKINRNFVVNRNLIISQFFIIFVFLTTVAQQQTDETSENQSYLKLKSKLKSRDFNKFLTKI